jgi:NADH-quinone oxidoreductase subunit K
MDFFKFTETIKTIPLNWYIILSMTLFCIGVVGILYRRNAISLIMSIELMLNSVNLLITAFSSYNGNPDGQIFVFFIMVVAAAEVTVGLAMIIMMYRNINSVDISLFNQLKW